MKKFFTEERIVPIGNTLLRAGKNLAIAGGTLCALAVIIFLPLDLATKKGGHRHERN